MSDKDGKLGVNDGVDDNRRNGTTSGLGSAAGPVDAAGQPNDNDTGNSAGPIVDAGSKGTKSRESAVAVPNALDGAGLGVEAQV